jgi:hypothetical protein
MPIDRTNVPAPAKRATPRQASNAKNDAIVAGEQRSTFQRRKEGVEGIGQAASLILLVRKQFADAQAVGMHTPPIATEMARIAETNEQWGKWLDYFSMTGPYAGLVKASLPLMLQLMANHGTIPAEAGAALGVVSPKVLELAGKVEQDKVEAALLLQIQEGRKEAQAMRDQLDKEVPSDGRSDG